MIDIHQLLAEIVDAGARLILIDGRGGAGKSTAAKQIVDKLQELNRSAEHFNLDQYQEESADLFSQKNIELGFDIDFQGRPYDLKKLTRALEYSSAEFKIVEGCFSFKIAELLDPDLKVWVELDVMVAADRLNKREMVDRPEISSDIIELSTLKWQESEDKYIDEYHPAEIADVVLNNS